MVFERFRRAERGHDRIPRELLDRPSCRLDLGGHRVVEALQPGAGALGILVAGGRGRVDEVGEEDGGELRSVRRRMAEVWPKRP